MLIDCDDCAVRDLACGDCVVTVLLAGTATASDPEGSDRPLGPAIRGVEVDDGERRALAVLADSGLVPRLRLVPLGLPRGVGPPGRAAAG